MTDEQQEERLDRLIREAAEAYHRPPSTPRDEMWRAIRTRRRGRGRAFRPAVRWLTWSTGVAAVLAAGIGIGFLLFRGEGIEAPPIAATPSPTPETNAGPLAHAGPSVALTVAATQHLGQAETFLLLFKSSVTEGLEAPMAPGTARRLLATNRLLSDSPVGSDPRYRELFEDLELVLAQIARLDGTTLEDEETLITEGIEQRAVLTRLQTVVPSGTTTPALNVGVL